MAIHNVLGKTGEEFAARYLIENGYRILERDWHSGHRDLDIIAWKEGMLIIVEVKTRRNENFGSPLEAISNQKIRSIMESTDAYLRYRRLDCHVRFDIITLVGTTPPFQLTHYTDAFRPPLW